MGEGGRHGKATWPWGPNMGVFSNEPYLRQTMMMHLLGETYIGKECKGTPTHEKETQGSPTCLIPFTLCSINWSQLCSLIF